MVIQKNKLPLKDILAAIDMKAKNIWDEFSDVEQKQIGFYILNTIHQDFLVIFINN